MTSTSTQLEATPQTVAAPLTRMPRVLILQGMCKQYRVPLYLRMRRDLLQAGVELRVAYSAPLGDQRARQDDAPLPPGLGVQIPSRAWFGDKLFLQLPLREIAQADLIVVEHALKHLVNYPLLLLSLLHLKRIAFWVHGGTFRHPSSGLARALRKRALLSAGWFFAYTEKVAGELAALGTPAARTTALQNAIDLSSFRAALACVSPAELAASCTRLDLPPEAHVALFCGSLYPGRGVHFLVQAGDRLSARDPLFHVLVIGSGPLAAELRSLAETRPWLHPLGSVFGDARAVYFRLAQVCLMPYLAGLGILDAMAAGLPYIVTGARSFNPEIDYLIDGVTGIITGDDASAYADQVEALLNDPPRLKRMSQCAREASGSYSIERMAENFSNGICACLAEGQETGSVEAPYDAPN